MNEEFIYSFEDLGNFTENHNRYFINPENENWGDTKYICFDGVYLHWIDLDNKLRESSSHDAFLFVNSWITHGRVREVDLLTALSNKSI